VRASVAAEKAGFPTTSIVLSGFLGQAKTVAQALGIKNLALAEYPGLVAMDSPDELRRKVTETVVKNIISGFTRQVEDIGQSREPKPRDIIFTGNLEEVQEHFLKNYWTDGLPVIPPTVDKIEKFLRFTTRKPDEIIGKLLPENREATVWNVAVNGVMAGCRPEYMPILLSVAEAVAAGNVGADVIRCVSVDFALLIELIVGAELRQEGFAGGEGSLRITGRGATGRLERTVGGGFNRLEAG